MRQSAESTAVLYDNMVNRADTINSPTGFWGRIAQILDEGDENKLKRNPDFSFIAAPAYSDDIKLSITALGSAIYSSVLSDSLTSLSNATAYATISTTSYWIVGIRGVHYGPRDKYRLNYKIAFESFPTYFWGIGYADEHFDSNRTKYLKLNFETRLSWEYNFFSDIYIGPALTLSYNDARDAANMSLWHGQRMRTFSLGPGLNIAFDSRDFDANAYSGWYIGLEQRIFPAFIGNHYTFASTDFSINHYRPLWRDCVGAVRLHSHFTYGDTPWSMMPFLGGSYEMRGYYEGRYRDKCAASATIELRQHLWRRNGIVVWGGLGAVFDKPSDLRSREFLPNFGIGYRWRLKHRVNIRIDWGFGKGESAFMFNINEAF